MFSARFFLNRVKRVVPTKHCRFRNTALFEITSLGTWTKQLRLSGNSRGQFLLKESTRYIIFWIAWILKIYTVNPIIGSSRNSGEKLRNTSSNDSSTTKKVNGFCGGIQALFQKAQEICNSDQVISSAEQLEKLEQKVCDLADQLQAIIIEERLQSSLDSEEVREIEADLVATPHGN